MLSTEIDGTIDDKVAHELARLAGEASIEVNVADLAWQTQTVASRVPGGVGPMTMTMLLENTIAAAERSASGLPHLSPRS